MSEMLRIRKSTLDAIGNSIRVKSGKTALINPLNMPAEILSLNAIGGNDDEEVTTSIIHYLKGTNPCLENGPWWIYPGETHSFVEGDGCLTLTASDNYGSMVKAIDLTDVDTITVVMASTSIGEYAKKFGGVFIAENAGDAQTVSVAKALVTQMEKAIYTIDVSNLSGTHFLRAESFNNVVISFYEIYGTYSTPKPIKPVAIDGLAWSMPPVKSYEDALSYGTVTTNATYTASYNHMINEIFQITKDTTTGFSLGGQEYVRWYWGGNKHKVHSFMTRTKYNYLGRIRVYGEKEDGTLIQLSTDTITSDTAGSGYGYNNAALLDYQESVDKNTEFVAIQIWNNTTSGNQYNMRAYFQFWLI